MSFIVIIVILVFTIHFVSAGQVCCPGLRCYSDSAPWNGFPLPECPEDMDVSMQIFTRNNRDSGQSISRNRIPSVYDGKRMTMFIAHGWKGDGALEWIKRMKDAVLTKADYNVILVDWKDGAKYLRYFKAASNTRTVGGEIALVNKKMITEGGSSRARQYCVGFSLGAHVCGHAGQQGQFGRITGLDPAGPDFEKRDWSCGLNPSCADYVDVIHSDGDALGTMKRLGHVDFYPNGGKTQEGCLSSYFDRRMLEYSNEYFIRNRKFIIDAIACDHYRAYDYFIESVRNDCFLSRYKCTNERFLPDSCIRTRTVEQSLGFKSNEYPGRGIFYLTADKRAPYCQG